MSSAQAELLQTVLAFEQYPWLPGETAIGEDDLMEKAGQGLEISDEDAAQGWQQLSAQLEQVWGAGSPLQQKFAGRLPAAMIAHISEKAQQLVLSGQSSHPSGRQSSQNNGQSVLEQMVVCVQDVMTHMAEADLRVFGRPLAMAMRGSSSDEFIEVTIQSIRMVEWEALSPIEQAKLSLAAARYALSQADQQD